MYTLSIVRMGVFDRFFRSNKAHVVRTRPAPFTVDTHWGAIGFHQVLSRNPSSDRYVWCGSEWVGGPGPLQKPLGPRLICSFRSEIFAVTSNGESSRSFRFDTLVLRMFMEEVHAHAGELAQFCAQPILDECEARFGASYRPPKLIPLSVELIAFTLALPGTTHALQPQTFSIRVVFDEDRPGSGGITENGAFELVGYFELQPSGKGTELRFVRSAVEGDEP